MLNKKACTTPTRHQGLPHPISLQVSTRINGTHLTRYIIMPFQYLCGSSMAIRHYVLQIYEIKRKGEPLGCPFFC